MDIEKICEFGRATIEIEAAMISRLTHRIDQKFAKACQYLHDCRGRIIVMGIGKSGHIGKKIAATLASTGSPAFFVHPSEAKHGDIGMITGVDVVVALSNSGESEEILSLLPAIKRLQAPLISLTGRSHSTLAKAATVNLDTSVEKEACPLGLAPTSSTTAALVMGDALAMALLSMRDFNEEDFARSHPGGSLGRRLLLKVDEIMHRDADIPIVMHSEPLKNALYEMSLKKLGMTTVVNDQGQLIGIFTDGDIRRTLDNHLDIQTTCMHQVMSTHPKTISKELLAADALNLMEQHKITSLVITNTENHPIGIIHIHDILRAGVV